LITIETSGVPTGQTHILGKLHHVKSSQNRNFKVFRLENNES